MNQATSRVDAAPTVRILAMMEAASVTGPAKNLIGFSSWLASAEGQQAGFSVAIATFDRSAAPGGEGFAAAARAAGIATYVIKERGRLDLGVLPQLQAIVAAVQPTIIQTHNGKSHLLIRALAALRARRVWFAFQHGYQDTDLKLRLYNQVDRLTLRYADRVVSVCQAFAPRLVAYGVDPRRIRILHNAAVPVRPVTELERTQLCERLGLRGEESVVLTIGRLSREKGHADLLRAMARLSSLPRWKLVIVGLGPERDSLEHLARALGISDRVIFAGFHTDVRGFYAIARVFVLPSYSEGSSNVLLEAMMARVPIAATRAGGNEEIVVDEETGLLTRARDPQSLADAIARLLQDPQLAARVVAAAVARAVNEFSVNRYRSRLLAYYAEGLADLSTGSFASKERS
jgi:glycosyltransferase involved in cell wall biosynthesis